ncbi:hypothetical protein A3H65_04260 [Candidatus Giovannonibacteria bacterium RIFCSPLOWO2_02_FULL_45_14]|uniref:Uncharacterized protein n=1 Tax=Candidatus Giovannonibacteria bacterium RIFCSPLOWO2_12_FULL_44_15 TaxID=1798364 RepID=A0A1F5XZW4_9BACT|nr:MAG: hypothetical protein A3C75_02455 [Candidatus Giovannonibacteria bacterium RIFCSPHIGHO2_02_FULL_44_31]OGF76205.1 MAG: hypothetical protein A3E62_01970 [Candidatus Giovannonibacteria bacterium RIFCSPHIGHO2_12_FULL_44_29]OGF91046.1 MAG: hypothetical protein A3H65_04260 [Candidatus Giovannonibacteria bacterium RIFCSPLOWO2_02_FULL_45_14]OGF93487.1 MAG: hypothetical protein A3G54_01030 [Candidatus Giovannonibacteria bacterium RIFCSPLOWO2_12_FULL_44_15]
MNFDFSKLKKFSLNPSHVRRGLFLEPEKLWGKFVWFLIIFAALAFAFNGWVFYRFYFNFPEGENLPAPQALKTKSFNKVLERIEKKKDSFNDYKNNLIIEDPS